MSLEIENIIKKLGILRYNSIGQLNNPYYAVTDEDLKQLIKLIAEECISICEENDAMYSAANIKDRFIP